MAVPQEYGEHGSGYVGFGALDCSKSGYRSCGQINESTSAKFLLKFGNE